MNFDEDRISEKETKEFMKKYISEFENTKKRVITVDLELSLEECRAISELLILMRKKKPFFSR